MKTLRHYWLRLLAWWFELGYTAPVGWVYWTLARYAWRAGYYAACKDLKDHTVVEMSSNDRMVACKHIRRPALYSYASDFLTCWDDGYHRAITLYRLGICPSVAWRSSNVYAKPFVVMSLEHSINTVLDGRYKQFPGKYLNSDGAVLLNVAKKQRELYEEYLRYGERRSQIWGELCRLNSELPTKEQHAKAL